MQVSAQRDERDQRSDASGGSSSELSLLLILARLVDEPARQRGRQPRKATPGLCGVVPLAPREVDGLSRLQLYLGFVAVVLPSHRFTLCTRVLLYVKFAREVALPAGVVIVIGLAGGPTSAAGAGTVAVIDVPGVLTATWGA